MSKFICLILILTFIFAGLLSACNDMGSSSSAHSSKSAGNSATLPTGGSVNALTITGAVRSNQDPNNLLELLGTAGDIGSLCPAIADCACRFNWLESNGTFREADQDLSYVEYNMARCLTTQITAGTGFFEVSLVIKAGNVTSNKIPVGVNSINPSLDPSLNSNFVPVQRYQCRDSMAKSAGIGGTNTSFYDGLADPRLWKMSYAFNFFSSSLGLDYGATGGSTNTTVTGWECPPIPNDSNFDSIFNLTLYSQDPVDLSNPLLTGVITGDNTIYPSSDNLNSAACVNGTEAACEQYKINRHDFYLAGFQDGIFKTPVCIEHNVASRLGGALKCGIDTKAGSPTLGSAALLKNGIGIDIVGFAAIPDANQNCPASNAVVIPTSKKWAKIWRMRASMPMRTIANVTASEIGELHCTDRKKECVAVAPNSGNTVYSVCHDAVGTAALTGAAGPFLGSWLSLAGTTKYGNCNSSGLTGDNQSLIPPVAYISTACNGSVNCCLDYNNSAIAVASRLPANYTPSGNYCNPALMGSVNGVGGGGEDVWLLGNGGRSPCIEADTDANGKLFSSAFPDPLNTYETSPKQLEANSAYDIVFVVTPPSVKIENMQDPNDAVGKQYKPIRVLPGGAQVVYNFDSNSSVPTTPPTPITSKYPLCVLQEKK